MTAAQRSRPMIKWLLIGIVGLLILAAAFLALVPSLVDAPKIQAVIAHAAGQALGRPVRFDSLSLSLLPLPALKLKNLQVAEDPKFGAIPFLTVSDGRLGLKIWPLLRGRVEVTELTLERPRVALIQEPGGRWNVASLGAAAGGAPSSAKPGGGSPGMSVLPLISRVRVVDGSLNYESRSKSGNTITYRLEGLTLTARSVGLGKAIEFDGETRVAPGDLRLKLVNGSLSPAVGRPLAELALKADVELQATYVASVVRSLVGPTPELGGPVQGKLVLSGTLANLTGRGQLELSRLRLSERRPHCPEPKTRSLTLEMVRFPLTYSPLRITGDPLSARLGSGNVSVALSLDFSPQPFLRVSEISIKQLPLEPVLSGYLCQGYAVSGPLDLTGDLSARPNDVWRTLAGQGRLRIGAGRVVGSQALTLFSSIARMGNALVSTLNLDVPQALFDSPVEFDSITASYRITNGLLTIEDFLYASPRFTVNAAGEYRLADGRMNLDLILKSGRTEIKARVTGTSASPSIQLRTPQKLLETGTERLRGLLRGLTGRSPQ